MQKRASELLLTHKDAPNFATVPPVYFSARINMRSVTNLLETSAITACSEWLPKISGKQVDLICGEYVDGIDFATYLFRAILTKARQHGVQVVLNEPLEKLSFDKLADIVMRRCLGLPSIEGDARYKENIELIFDHNSSKIFAAAAQFGIEIHNIIGMKLLNTLLLLNSNGMFHNDLHSRNIVVFPGKAGKFPDVAIIDFDLASGTQTGRGDTILARQISGYRTAEQQEIENNKLREENANKTISAIAEILNNQKLPWVRKLVYGLDHDGNPISMPLDLPKALNEKALDKKNAETLTKLLSTYASSNRLEALAYIFCILKKNSLVDSQKPITQACKAVLLALYPLDALKQIFNPPKDRNSPTLKGLDRGYFGDSIIRAIGKQDVAENYPLVVNVLAKKDPIAALEYVFECNTGILLRSNGYKAIERVLGVPEQLLALAKKKVLWKFEEWL